MTGAPGGSPPLPWDDVLAFGLGVLRWPPDVFWRATPRELAAALRGMRGRAGAEPLGRADLHDLMTLFPDQESSP